MPKKDAIQPVAPAPPALQPAQVVKIRNLITSPMAMRRVALGDIAGFRGWIERMRPRIEAVLWNETEITLVTDAPDMEVRFAPEFHPATAMFLAREEKHDRDEQVRVWEGEFEPIRFSKTDLLKFLKKNSEYFDPAVQDAIKNLKVTEKKSQDTELIGLEDDENYRNVEEQVQSTNLPSRFHATMPLFGDLAVNLEFEAKVVPAKDKHGYATEGNKKQILVRCVNAREELRAAMQRILTGLPGDLPVFYGRMRTTQKER
jgi:hypothetical protein